MTVERGSNLENERDHLNVEPRQHPRSQVRPVQVLAIRHLEGLRGGDPLDVAIGRARQDAGHVDVFQVEQRLAQACLEDHQCTEQIEVLQQVEDAERIDPGLSEAVRRTRRIWGMSVMSKVMVK